MKRRDLVSSLFFILLSGYACWESAGLGLGSFKKPGPGFFSFFSALGVVFFGLIVFLEAFSMKKHEKETQEEEVPLGPLATTFGSLIAFTLLLKTIGFNIATFLFITALLHLVGKKTWSMSLLFALGVSLGSYVLFELLLRTQLPRGFLGI